VVVRNGKPYLTIDPKQRDLKKNDRYFSVNSGDDEEIIDFPDYILGSHSMKPKVDLSSKASIDDFFDRHVHMDAELITSLGYADHVKNIVEQYGEEVFIAVHIPSAVCEIFDPIYGYIGFEDGLMAFIEQADGMQYLLERSYEEQLHWARAYASAGAHAYIISECYISPDIVNPDMYRQFLKGIHKDYFAEVANMCTIPMCMFWGDVNPILEDLTQINIKGLLVEESKKGFDLDIGRISRQIGDRLCLFGNVDSIDLLINGRPAEVRRSVREQIMACGDTFVVANGSPLAPGTPVENVRAMIEEVKGA
jgi:hypothetical protein